MSMLLAGVLGAVAAAVGKLTLSTDSLIFVKYGHLCRAYFTSSIFHAGDDTHEHTFCNGSALMLRGVAFLCMLMLNAHMMKNFLEALSRHSSSVVTMIVSAVNFATTVSLHFTHFTLLHCTHFTYFTSLYSNLIF